MSVWSPYAHGNGLWIARNIITGFVSAPIEALPEASITDVYFAHERGTYMGWYAWTLAASNYFAPVICGFINDGVGYEWPFFIMAIFCGASFVFLFFFLEETNYDRRSVGVVYDDHPSDGKTPTKQDSDSPISADEKKSPVGAVDGGESTAGAGGVMTRPTLHGTEKTFWQKLALFDKPRPFLMHWRAWQILRLIPWPGVFFSGFSWGTYLIWFNILNATASIILSAPPYNFAPSIVGLTYISCCIGVTLGYVLLSEVCRRAWLVDADLLKGVVYGGHV